MKKIDLKETITLLRLFEKKNRPTILAAIGVAGVWTTSFLAFRAAPKASEVLEKHKKRMDEVEPDNKEEKKKIYAETAAGIALHILPVVAVGTISSTCIIFSNTISNKRIMTLSAAYALTDSSLRELKEKMPEVLGEARTQKVRESISKERLANADNPENSTDIVLGTGDVLCYDEYTGRYFSSNAEKIGAAILKLSYELQSDMWISLNEFYDELELDRVKMGEDLGWSVDASDKGRIPIYYTALLTETKQPCLCIQFDVQVRERYY